MSYLLAHFWPGATEENYQTEIAAVHPPNGLPEGQTWHAAGPTEGGYLIVSVWESKEDADLFVNTTLLPAHPLPGGFPHPVEERGAVIANHWLA